MTLAIVLLSVAMLVLTCVWLLLMARMDDIENRLVEVELYLLDQKYGEDEQ